ncbi:MAG: prolyl oligopeptidase family serine peptidase [Wenzhouxiangellaceae bacterium]|nr:prolyl oligopeptidase family serine peptidase [Wenzhouxiangellaceae bacterium]
MPIRTLRILGLALLVVVTRAGAADLDLRQIMADPDWIGPPVEAAWWQFDDDSYVYRAKRADSEIRDLFRIDPDSGEITRLEAAKRAAIDGSSPVFDRDRTRALSVRDGNLFLRNLADGGLKQLTAGLDGAGNPGFATDPNLVHFQVGVNWYRLDLTTGLHRPVADLRFDDAPHAVGDNALERHQLELFSTLERDRRRAAAAHDEAVANTAADPGRTPAPWYLGKGMEIAASALSADGRWLLAVVQKTGTDTGKNDKMPKFVTRSGYVEIEDVRTLVGRDASTPQQLWLLDLIDRDKHELDLKTLSGRDIDPLAELKAAQDITPHDAANPRPLRITGIEWHPQSNHAAVQVRAIDNKDRWTLRLEASEQKLSEIHRLTDPAWINWAFNEFGWVPDSERIWLLSEESGYSHLYTVDARGRIRQHSKGSFEVYDVAFSADGKQAWVLSNRAHPTEYDLYRLSLADNELTRLTELKGVESYALHPTRAAILVRYSDSYLPTQAAIVQASGELIAATDTRSDDYRAIEWQQPEFVAIPSSHVDEPIWTKFYPARGDHEGPRPVVVFVHGAGYTQNTHHRFPYYFREQMFHNLLSARGYHVIDMDYRASRGYGRDWRTAIYRQMGTPELEDLIDGVNWLVDNHNADPQRVGVYGGSYGGFMTFMAMFNAPEVFAAGAALRPVTDWVHYNHGYTSNILNTPQVDPDAHRRSSPIEFVEGLQGALLISHGMLDDNVFYKDSIRLAQRLIELEKENWELASYPLEPHGYIHPESWLDQYRRILKLFETTIGD